MTRRLQLSSPGLRGGSASVARGSGIGTPEDDGAASSQAAPDLVNSPEGPTPVGRAGDGSQPDTELHCHTYRLLPGG